MNLFELLVPDTS